MNAKSKPARIALGIAATAAALAAFTPAAMAQNYQSYQSYAGSNQAYDARGYSYDACQRDQTSRATVGALLGGAAGLAVGNNAVPDRYYGRGRVDSNRGATAVAGVIGAIIGSQIGKSSAACTPAHTQTYTSYSYSAPAPAYEYARPGDYPRETYYDQYQDRYADNRGYAEPTPRCTYVESSVRMPDGRSQTRMVQACQDSRGRYQIVQ